MGFIRSILSLALLAGFVLIGLTVPIGDRTLFGHVGNIWGSDEAQELVDGVKDSSGPLVDRVKRGVSAGLEDESDAQSSDDSVASPHDDSAANSKSASNDEPK